MAIKFIAPKSMGDIPITHDVTTKFVPWIVAMLVFLLCLIMAGASSISTSLYNWHSGVTNKVTIEIPIQNEAEREKTVPSALKIIKNVPGIAKADFVDSQRLLRIVEPWIGQTEIIKDLPLPILIDADVRPGFVIDWSDVSAKLRQYAAGARIEHHSQWQETLAMLRSSLQMVAYIIAFLIAMIIMTTVVLVTRSGFDAHREDISVLQLLGANTAYISRQFQFQALLLSFKGAGGGFIVALPVILLLSWLSEGLGIPEIMRPVADWHLFFTLLAIPFVIVALSMIVARFSVVHTLSKII